jgi:broad specificity phosphatase PhoE
MKLENNYFLLRHGESLKNVKGFESCWPEKKRIPLTRQGREQIKIAAKTVTEKKIGLIFCSDLLRTKQTAEIVGKIVKVKPKLDKRLREIGLGIFNGRSVKEFGDFWNQGEKLSPAQHYQRRFIIPLPKGETYAQAELRLLSFIKDVEGKYRGKNILVVSHQRPLTLLEKAVKGYSILKFVNLIVNKKEIKTGELRKL